MNYNEINFNKKNRRPVTDTTYQIAAEEWNALGAEVSRQQARLNTLDPSGAGTDDAQFVTDEELDAVEQNMAAALAALGASVPTMEQQLITYDAFLALGNSKQFRYYFVAKDAQGVTDKKCWRIYLGKQLVGIFNVNGSLTMPKFPLRFPFRFA